MFLCIFVKNTHTRFITDVESISKATGIGKIIGNKGGVMISLKYFGMSFCFINSHLAAKPQNVELRKENYYDLCKHLRTGNTELESIYQFDYVFWMGDFNFRIDSWIDVILVPFDDTVIHLNNDEMEIVQENDQLRAQQYQNNVFSDFAV